MSMFRERWRSLLNAAIIRAAMGKPISRQELARALRIKNTIHALKRNGRSNANGKVLRLTTASHALRKDLI